MSDSGDTREVARALFSLAVLLWDCADELADAGFEDLGLRTNAISEELGDHAVAMLRTAREEG